MLCFSLFRIKACLMISIFKEENFKNSNFNKFKRIKYKFNKYILYFILEVYRI
jgi:hypothetical protein